MMIPECPYNEGVECIEADRISNVCFRCAWCTDGHTAERRLEKIKNRLRCTRPEAATKGIVCVL